MRLAGASLGHLHPGSFGKIAGRDVNGLQVDLSSRLEVFSLEVAVDGDGYLAARLDGFYHGGRAGDHVAAGKDARNGGRIR